MIRTLNTLIVLFLSLPCVIIVNNIITNVFYKNDPNHTTNKTINTCIYSTLFILSIVLLIMTGNGFRLTLIPITKNMVISFTLNTFNLIFCGFFCLLFLFFNYQFQKSFILLRLESIYILYNLQLSFLFYACFLLIFSHNLVISVLLYMLVIFSSLLLLFNYDLKDIKNRYATPFVIGMSTCILLLIAIAMFSYFSQRFTYVATELESYWLLPLLFALIYVNFMWPIYLIFKERIFYEDMLLIFIIDFVPFILINTFLFVKISVFMFSGNYKPLLFFYTGFFAIIPFLISIYPLLSQLKNNRKFVILFGVSSFLAQISQLFFSRDVEDILLFFTNFMVLVVSVLTAALCYASIMFYMLKLSINETSLLYTKNKKELRFFLITIFNIIVVLCVSFFSLNFANFNVLWLINLFQIFILLIIFVVYVFFCIYKKPSKMKEFSQITSGEKFEMFDSSLILFVITLLLFYFKGAIFRQLIKASN